VSRDDTLVAGLMSKLAASRPIFHSEADFQHAFAWQLRLHHPDARVRLELRPPTTPPLALDVFAVIDGARIGFELKYLVRACSFEFDGEPFALKAQGAQDVRRYDFIKDIARLERLRAEGFIDAGHAIAVSNDASYWTQGRKPDAVDLAFRLHEGRVLEGSVGWSAAAGAGTVKGRELPITLEGTWTVEWRDFSQIFDRPGGRFRYLAVGVRG
jgi:hypothetical protein